MLAAVTMYYASAFEFVYKIYAMRGAFARGRYQFHHFAYYAFGPVLLLLLDLRSFSF